MREERSEKGCRVNHLKKRKGREFRWDNGKRGDGERINVRWVVKRKDREDWRREGNGQWLRKCESGAAWSMAPSRGRASLEAPGRPSRKPVFPRASAADADFGRRTNTNRLPIWGARCYDKVAATYSPAFYCSTIGAAGLNFSVRDGKRWTPAL